MCELASVFAHARTGAYHPPMTRSQSAVQIEAVGIDRQIIAVKAAIDITTPADL
jgi:hypothetical protein